MLASRLTHGAGMTRCGASSTSSPRCAASCCTHHWQIFLNVRGGSCRPHRMQFAMSYTKVSAVESVVGSTEHSPGVDERFEPKRFTGAKARIECASDAALKGRSSTVRDRVGSATRMLCRSRLPGRFHAVACVASLRRADEASAPTQDLVNCLCFARHVIH